MSPYMGQLGKVRDVGEFVQVYHVILVVRLNIDIYFMTSTCPRSDEHNSTSLQHRAAGLNRTM